MFTYSHVNVTEFCWTSGPGLEGAEHLEQVQELQKAGCGSAKKRRTFHGKCVENGDQMLINQHQLWDFARNSEIFGSEVHPGYCGGPWQLAGYPFKFRAFWPPHGLVVFTSKVKRLNILWQTNWFHMTFTIFTARPTFTPLKALYSSDMSLLCQLLISRSQRSLRIVAMRKTTFLVFLTIHCSHNVTLPPYCFCPGSAGTGTSEANAAVEGHCCKRDL